MFNTILQDAFADLQAAQHQDEEAQLAIIEAGMEALEKEVAALEDTPIIDGEYTQLEAGLSQLVSMVEGLEDLAVLVDGQEEMNDAQLGTALLAYNQLMAPAGVYLAAEDVKKEDGTPADTKKSLGDKIRSGASGAAATLKKWILAFVDGARKLIQKYMTANGIALIAAKKTQAAVKTGTYNKTILDSGKLVITTNGAYLLSEFDGKQGKIYGEAELKALFKRLQSTANPSNYRKEIGGLIKELAGVSDSAKIREVINKAVEATKKYLGASKSESGQGGEVFTSEDMGGSLYYYVVLPTKGAPRVGAKFRNPKIAAHATSFGNVTCPGHEEIVVLSEVAVDILTDIVSYKTAYEDMREFTAGVDEVVKSEGAASGIQTAVSMIVGLSQQAINLQLTHSGRFARNASAIALNARAVLTRKENPTEGDKGNEDKK